ncbi:MAG: RAMP superfamily CRISPR-associated protein [bacterium]|nr:RAMP superfamily CRISPR-associated protein [bacterium]
MDPTIPDMRFVRTHSALDETVFIPGSSLKGVVRSYSERVLKTLKSQACNPLVAPCNKDAKVYEDYVKALQKSERQRGTPPSLPRQEEIKRFVEGKTSRQLPSVFPYALHCYACRTFGSTSLSSHTRIADAYPWKWEMDEDTRKESLSKIKTDVRTCVAIDRQTGAGKKTGLFDLEVVTAGTFYGEILMRNFQIWQLALIGLTLQHIDEGYQQLGFGKSRGLGEVSLRIAKIEINNYDQLASKKKINGLGQLDKDRTGRYGLIEGDSVSADDFEESSIPLGISYVSTNGPGFLSTLLKSENWQKLTGGDK